ncbi:Uncharacterized protein HZ326_3295 [Fusarium oxysporum f. sp. albedinis]|nr:Uncharacterized protein HZ326_3295 [Fusarium oxysporum f. sp. albedinis]
MMYSGALTSSAAPAADSSVKAVTSAMQIPHRFSPRYDANSNRPSSSSSHQVSNADLSVGTEGADPTNSLTCT